MSWEGQNCEVVGCCGPVGHGPFGFACDRHRIDPLAPPMKLICECAEPDVERLPAFGPDCAYCRKCGSPMEGALK